jgi:hypothetical protein
MQNPTPAWLLINMIKVIKKNVFRVEAELRFHPF